MIYVDNMIGNMSCI